MDLYSCLVIDTIKMLPFILMPFSKLFSFFKLNHKNYLENKQTIVVVARPKKPN